MIPSNKTIKEYILELIEKKQVYKFYQTTEWKHIKSEVLQKQHNECQICKRKGRYTKADTVHHIQYVRSHPELALSKTYINARGKEQVNLIAICKACHNQVHDKFKHKPKFTNTERW